MKKAGVPQFDQNSFQVAYDKSPQLQNIVEYSPEGIEIKDNAAYPELDSEQQDDSGSKSTVSQMAKSAVDLDDL